MGSTTPAYRKQDAYTFRTSVTSLQLASGLANALHQLKIDQCGIIFQDDDYGNGVQEIFRARFTSTGAKVTVTEAFQPSESNFRTQLLRFKAAQVSAIVVVARYSITGTLLKQAREIGIDARFFGDSYTVESDEVIQTAAKAVEGFTYIAPRFGADAGSVASKFYERFREKYGESPVQLSAQAYDGVMAIALAMRACQQIQAECLRQAMKKLAFEGASGFVEFDEMGDVKSRPTVLKMVRAGKFVVADGE